MTYYALCGGVALSQCQNVFCEKVGLGSPEQVGIQTLNIVSNDGGGSSLHATSGILRREKIVLKTLDGDFDFGGREIGFIKMDVEDNEIMVLQGAKTTIVASGRPAIVFESNDATKFREIQSYLIETLGYEAVVKINGTNNMFLATTN
jgi:FkbM family methyltransferase